MLEWCVCVVVVVVFFKQKTAYERRISDWSSDVCSSDLDGALRAGSGRLQGAGALGHHRTFGGVQAGAQGSEELQDRSLRRSRLLRRGHRGVSLKAANA